MRPPSQDELSSSVLFSSTYGVSYLLHIGIWEGRIVTEMCLLPWAGTCHHCPLPFRPLWSAIYFLQGFPFFPQLWDYTGLLGLPQGVKEVILVVSPSHAP